MHMDNKAIRDGRPRPPRHQVGWDIVTRECACQISWWSVEKWRRYYILKFRGNTFRWPMTLTFDLKFWKYLSVTVYPYVICMPSFIMIGWEMAEILHFDTNPESLRPFVPEIWPNNVFNLSATYDLDLWPLKFCENTDKHTNKHTNTQTHKQTDRHGHYNTSPSPYGGEVTNRHGHYNTSPSPYGGRGNYSVFRQFSSIHSKRNYWNLPGLPVRPCFLEIRITSTRYPNVIKCAPSLGTI